MIVRSGALGNTDIQAVPRPLVCSRRRAWSLGEAESKRRSIFAFPMASVQCFWCHLDGSAVANRSCRPCHECRVSNCVPSRPTRSSRTGVMAAEDGVRAYRGTATLSQPPPRKASSAEMRAAGMTSRGLFRPQPPVDSGRDAWSRCCCDKAQPTRSSKADITMSLALAVCSGTQ
jgi:hypothetical protein